MPLWSNSRYPFFYVFVHNRSFLVISCQISIYYEHYNARFLALYFRESSAAINFLVENWSKWHHFLKNTALIEIIITISVENCTNTGAKVFVLLRRCGLLFINKYHIAFYYSHFNTIYINFLKWVTLSESSFSSLNYVRFMASLFSLGTKIFYSLTTLSTVSNSFLFFLDSGRASAGGNEGGSGEGVGGRGGSDGRFEGSEGGIGESDGSDVESIRGIFPSRPGAMPLLQRIAR